MIEQKKQEKKYKTYNKISKTNSNRVHQKVDIHLEEQHMSISELSNTSDFTQIEKLNDNLQQIVSLSMLGIEEFKDQLNEQLCVLRGLNIDRINQKQIVGYLVIEKLLYLQRQLAEVQGVNIETIIEQKQKLLQIFRAGIRQFGYLKKYYKIN